MKKKFLYLFLCVVGFNTISAQKQPVDYVNPFIGSTNYGTTNPGAMQPQSLMSVTPFNVMGSDLNVNDKDARWWSTPYSYENKYLTGFSHVNLSGVGCPDMSSLLLMATTGDLEVDYHKYGSEYKDEIAKPGYYANILTKYNIKAEVTATPRVGLTRFSFPKGQGNILLNLGEGLTNESGATVKRVNDREIEGSKLLGSFCYTTSQAVFPIYFVMRVNKTPKETGYWKFQRPGHEWENEWNLEAGKYKIYKNYNREMSGDDIGVFFTFDNEKEESIEVQIGVSFVSIENARLNLETEQPVANFDQIRKNASNRWNEDLSRIMVEGGTEDQKTIFYTALYHTLIHPNILQDVNGEYPAMESLEVKKTNKNRYTVFSLWDTYRNVHQLMTLVYPERQIQMMNSMVDMYKEGGWLPKWELYSRESYTMEGDPSIPVLVDAWYKGLKNFDIQAAYQAMYKSAMSPSKTNKLRPDNDDYMKLGYVPLRGEFDNSVSHALEYYVADWNLARFAEALGKKKDAEYFYKRSLGYKNYYDNETGIFRPKLPNGKFLTPFNPALGMSFEPNPGFHEGSAWNYAFAVPHDIPGLIKLMGGEKKFTNKLQSVFDNGYYDVTNEPDINYPHFFSNIKGEEWRTQKIISELINKHYKNAPDGLPGNDDVGTLSTWLIFNMMGFYPECPGRPDYTLTSPVFDKVTIKLNQDYYKPRVIEITKTTPKDHPNANYIDKLVIDGKAKNGFHITHDELTNAKSINYIMKVDK